MNTEWLPCPEAARYGIAVLLILSENRYNGECWEDVTEAICKDEGAAFLKRLEVLLYGNALPYREGLQSNVPIDCVEEGGVWRISLCLLCPPDIEPLQFVQGVKEAWFKSEWANNLLFEVQQRYSWLDAGLYD